jgi:hypothetical protein
MLVVKTVLWLDRSGAEHRIAANAVVLCGNGIGTSRLLLLSESPTHLDGHRSAQTSRRCQCAAPTRCKACDDDEAVDSAARMPGRAGWFGATNYV